MVSWNQAELTLEALAALEARTEPCFEVILVDNGSVGEALLRLREAVSGATILSLGDNRGFGGAANLGAMAARAEHLCFLNNDAVVLDGWLPPLIARLATDPGIGAVSPCILNRDATLQEAGSHLYSNGFTFAYGEGDDPGRPPYRFPRDVDYASAVCLLVPRRVFELAGGFDVRYHPAYFEDVDLCLELRTLGLRTVYEPASKVVHVRHGSTSAGAAVELLRRNRAVFFERWPDATRLRPGTLTAETNHWSSIACRDVLAEDRVLIVDDRVPYFDRGSGDPRSAVIVREIARLWPRSRVTLLAVNPQEAERYAPPLWEAGVEIVWGFGDWGEWLETRRFHYSVVIVSRPHNHDRLDAALRRTQPQALRVYDVEALSFRRLERQAGVAESLAKAAELRAEARAMLRLEVEAVKSADSVWAVSEEEIGFVAAIAPKVPTFRLTYPVVLAERPPCFSERSNLVFFGGFLAGPGSPNEDAVLVLKETILPLLQSFDSSLRLTILGADPTPAVLTAARDGVDVIGYVGDPRPFLESARLMVVPARYGAGIKLKLLDSIAAGLPFVTTPVGAEGLRLGDLEEMLVADDPVSLARLARRLLSSPGLWTEVQHRLVALAATEFSLDGFRATLVDAMAALGISPPHLPSPDEPALAAR